MTKPGCKCWKEIREKFNGPEIYIKYDDAGYSVESWNNEWMGCPYCLEKAEAI
jgi:hypothetical protein